MQPPDEDGGDGYCGHEDVGAAVIVCCDAPPIFELAEHVLDLMALFVFGFAIGGRKVPAFAGWNANRHSLGFKGGAILIGIIALVGDHRRLGAARQGRIENLRTDMVSGLPGRQAHCDRAAFAVTDRMQFGIHVAFCAPEMTGKNPPF